MCPMWQRLRDLRRPPGRSARPGVTRTGAASFVCALLLFVLSAPLRAAPAALPSDPHASASCPGHSASASERDGLPGHHMVPIPATSWPALEAREHRLDRVDGSRRARSRGTPEGTAAPPPGPARMRAVARHRLARPPRLTGEHLGLVRTGHLSIPPPDRRAS